VYGNSSFNRLSQKQLTGCRFRANSGENASSYSTHNTSRLGLDATFHVSLFVKITGTLYGFGVYFSSDAAYSHGYTKPNANDERCMFLARFIIEETTQGNNKMETRPPGFDSTTDGNHIFVTYHGAQALVEYLITYK
ncbi:unnamed protein product, partial [Rotaria magnacalcarata]